MGFLTEVGITTGALEEQRRDREAQTQQLLMSLISANPGLMSNEAIASQVGSAFKARPGITDILSNLKGAQVDEETRQRTLATEALQAERAFDRATLEEKRTFEAGLLSEERGREDRLAEEALEQEILDREDKQAAELEQITAREQAKGENPLLKAMSLQAQTTDRLLGALLDTEQEGGPVPGAAKAGDALVGSVQEKHATNLAEMFAIKHIRDTRALSRNPFKSKPSAMDLIEMKDTQPDEFEAEYGGEFAQGLRMSTVYEDGLASQIGADPELGGIYQDMLVQKMTAEQRLQAAQQFPETTVRPGFEGIHGGIQQQLSEPFGLNAPRQIDEAPLSPEAQLALPPGADVAPDPISAPQLQMEIPVEVQGWIVQQPPEFQPYYKMIAEEWAPLGDSEETLRQFELFQQQLAAMAYADQLRGNSQ